MQNPLAPEVMKVDKSMLLEYQLVFYKQIYCTEKKVVEAKGEKTSKVILNSNDKSRCVSHIKILQFYLNHYLKLRKIHRCISFNQSKWSKTTKISTLRKMEGGKYRFWKGYV